MVIITETKSQEAYTPLGNFQDRLIDFGTFLEGIKINFKREFKLSFNDSRTEDLIVVADPANVKINTSGITIQNRNTGLIYTLNFKNMDIGFISEVSNVSSFDYIFPLARNKRMFFRIAVR